MQKFLKKDIEKQLDFILDKYRNVAIPETVLNKYSEEQINVIIASYIDTEIFKYLYSLQAVRLILKFNRSCIYSLINNSFLIKIGILITPTPQTDIIIEKEYKLNPKD